MKEYTIEEKALAVLEERLWWRFQGQPIGAKDYEWSKITDDFEKVSKEDISKEGAVYHIGDTAPRILTDLETELLGVLRCVHQLFAEGKAYPMKMVEDAIAKGDA
jgi:hypothetical protein